MHGGMGYVRPRGSNNEQKKHKKLCQKRRSRERKRERVTTTTTNLICQQNIDLHSCAGGIISEESFIYIPARSDYLNLREKCTLYFFLNLAKSQS